MALYHCLLDTDSEKPPLFLGKVPLKKSDGCVRPDLHREKAPIGDDGTVPAPWKEGKETGVEVPTTVDTSDPFQLAPMVSFWRRPIPALEEIVVGNPQTVHVYQTEKNETQSTRSIEGYEYKEDSGATSGKIKRWQEWDDSEISPSVVADEAPNFADVTHLVGFSDGQDMHDPYTHLGCSATDTAAGALRDVLERISGVPLWKSKAYRVTGSQSFPAADVLASVTESGEIASV